MYTHVCNQIVSKLNTIKHFLIKKILNVLSVTLFQHNTCLQVLAILGGFSHNNRKLYTDVQILKYIYIFSRYSKQKIHNHSNTTYSIDEKNIQVDCSKISLNNTELAINCKQTDGCSGFASKNGIKNAINLEQITIRNYSHSPKLTERETLQNLKEIVLERCLNFEANTHQKLQVNLKLDYSYGKMCPVNSIPLSIVSLNASNCFLKRQPDLSKFRQLSEVVFGEIEGFNNNQLGTIDQNLLPECIQKLWLCCCEVQQGINLLQLNQLEDLALCRNTDIKQIYVQNIPQSLRSLNLGDCSLSDMSDLHALKNITDLWLNENKEITQIQEDLFPPSIEMLDLSDCNIQQASNFSRFQNLKVLDLSRNKQLLQIPAESIPKSIETLWLRHCGLTKMIDLSPFRQLKDFDISWNNISQIRLPLSIQVLNLRLCDLVELPNLHSFVNLVELNLSGNSDVKQIPSGHLPSSLQKLDLSCANQPELINLCNLNRLRFLDVCTCKIVDSDYLQVLELMPHLTEFYCCDNAISIEKEIEVKLSLVLTKSISCVKAFAWETDSTESIKKMIGRKHGVTFSKSLESMLDEQFYELHKAEIQNVENQLQNQNSENLLIKDMIMLQRNVRTQIEIETERVAQFIAMQIERE